MSDLTRSPARGAAEERDPGLEMSKGHASYISDPPFGSTSVIYSRPLRWRVAKVYGGRWEIEGSLDRGGQGEVFLVRDRTLVEAGPYALKRVLNPARRERFLREVAACTRLAHKGVMRVLDHSALTHDGSEAEKMFLVMPLAAGGNLERRAGMYRDSIDTTVAIAIQLAEALAHAHAAGVIHRDVKPANILFWREDHECVLSDFGICLVRDEVRLTDLDEAPGPRSFMAPELEGGGKLDVTPAADVYSLGKVIYFMLSGGVILPRERLHEGGYNIFGGRGLRYALVGRLLDRMICPLATRITSMREVATELERIRDWDAAPSTAISTGAATVLASFVERERAAIGIEEQNRVLQAKREALLADYRASVGGWLDSQIAGIVNVLNVPGVFSASAIDNAGVARLADIELQGERRWMVPPRRAHMVFELGRGVALSPVRGLSKTKYLLQFRVLSPREVRVTFGNAPVREVDGDPAMWFVAHCFIDARMQGYVKQKSKIKSPAHESFTRDLAGKQSHLCVETSIGSWPTAVEDYKKVIDEAVEVVVAFIDAAGRSGSYSFG